MMEAWRKIRLGSACETNVDSYSPKEEWTFVNYLDTGNITENRIDSIQYIDVKNEKLPSRARRKVKTDSIIYSTVRPNQRHFGIIKSQPENFLVSTGFAVIEVNAEVLDADFLYYLLTQATLVEALHAIAEQSTSAYPSIKASDIEDLEIEIPDLGTQKKIADVLGSLDRKMAQNMAINKNLEQQADALYQEFFSPKSGTQGKIATLDEYCSIFTGKKNANASVDGGQYKFFTCAPDALQIDSYIYDGNAIIVSGNGAYTGRTRFYSGRFDLYQRTYACTLLDNINPDYIFPLYWFVKLELSKKIMGGTRGSAIPYIVMNDLAKFEFIYNNETFAQYMPIFKTLTEIIQANEFENETLANTRDSLLPQLMSGELDVSDIDL